MRIRIKQASIASIAAIFILSGVLFAAAADKTPITDQTVKAMVEHRLEEKHLLEQGTFTVSVENHVVTLSGAVTSLRAKDQIEREVRSSDDDLRVLNQLTVAAGQRTDDQIAAEVSRSLRHYAFYDIFDWVDGKVHDGVVTLEGYVHQPWRKEDYERLTEGVIGARQIVNNLKVLPVSTFDDQIRVAAARAIYRDPVLENYAFQPYPPIHIVVDNGRIRLEGVVFNALERQVAETDVRTKVMAFEVVNNLKIEKSDSPREATKPAPNED